ncbi:hypothetical protein BAPKO_0126 [Borreliella afzelii PKo]|nr:hypothetical protein BAPKO_0126 [Borreliella afzelii PKo]
MEEYDSIFFSFDFNKHYYFFFDKLFCYVFKHIEFQVFSNLFNKFFRWHCIFIFYSFFLF